jgi:hypothetical protein
VDPLIAEQARCALARRHRDLLRRQAHYLMPSAGDGPDYLAALSETEREELEELEEAARLLDEGELGRCEECGRSLGAEHVRDTPWIRRCSPCRNH